MKRKLVLLILITLFSALAHAATETDTLISSADFDNKKRFTTWQGIEPDKWATLWLIKRYISPDSYFLLVPPNTDLPFGALPFGVPDVAIRRANRESMFRRLKQAMKLDNPSLTYIDRIVHDVEVNIWDAPTHPHSSWLETLYRQLQARYQRDQVPVDCYLAFFDIVASLAEQEAISPDEYQDQLNLKVRCPGIQQKKETLVGSLGHLDILREISLGKQVIFLDTRETEEFNETHLPGAQLLRLRDVNGENAHDLLEADLVVPYCVKDFRGFEVAKALKRHGVNRVATLSPNGLKGWLAAGLPVARFGEMDDAQAIEKLMQCAMEPSHCGIPPNSDKADQ